MLLKMFTDQLQNVHINYAFSALKLQFERGASFSKFDATIRHVLIRKGVVYSILYLVNLYRHGIVGSLFYYN